MAKYHINIHGVPAICRAEKNKCPRGGEGDHFDNLEDAQAEADRRGESEFGIIKGVNDSKTEEPKEEKPHIETKEEREKREEKERRALFQKYKKIVNARKGKRSSFVKARGEDLDLRRVIHPKGRDPGKTPSGYGREEGLLYIDYAKEDFHKTKEEAESKRNPIPYYFRVEESRRLRSRFQRKGTTRHYNVDRKGRRAEINRLFGKGKIVGNYLLYHDISEEGEPKNYAWQVAEIRDTGQITMYGERSGKAITTLVPSRQRMEAIIIKAGEVPNKDFLDRVEINREIWIKENQAEKIQRAYMKERKKRLENNS